MLYSIRRERRPGLIVTPVAVIACWLSLAAVSVTGCRQQASAPADSAAHPNDGAPAAGENSSPHITAPRETWEALYLGGAKVGHTQTRYEPLQEGDQSLVQITAVSEMTMKRFDQTVKQKITYTSVEHPDGRIVRFSSSLGTPPNETAAKGHFRGGKLHVTTTTPGKSVDSVLGWDPTWRGFFGPEQSLREKPMKPGEKRTFRSLMAIFNMIGEIDLTAHDYETTKLLSGEQSLLRIESRTRIGETTIDATIWADAEGQALKVAMPTMKQETFRTTREVALQAGGSAAFDLGEATVVRIAAPLSRPHRNRQIVYRATIAGGDPVAAFVPGATQAIKRLDAHTAEVTVRALRAETAMDLALGPDQGPTAEDRVPNNLIQSDDPAVVAIAESVAAGETDPWRVAQALEKRVQTLVRVTQFSQAIASAAEVARSKQGDCTEHAMLLAAACRARQIPARVAIGLVYYGQARGFAYHMWTEVWIGQHWIPLDATLGQGGIGAAHLKVATSNLSGGSGYSAVLPVFDVMGRLELEIVGVQGPE